MDTLDKLVKLFIELFRWYANKNKVLSDVLYHIKKIFINRNCTNPSPANNGAPCIGSSYQYETCNDNVPCVICMFEFFVCIVIKIVFFSLLEIQ